MSELRQLQYLRRPLHRQFTLYPGVSFVVQGAFGVGFWGVLAGLFLIGVLAHLAVLAWTPAYLGVPALIGGYWCLTVYRRTIRRQVLVYLEQAMRLNFPLADYLDAAAKSEPAPLARRLNLLAMLLRRGRPVSASLMDVVPEITTQQINYLSAAEAGGNLRDAVRQLADRERRRHEQRDESAIFYRVYGMLVVGSVILMMLAMFIFVVPKFREIFNDFKTTLPAITLGVLSFAEFITESGFIWLALIILAMLCLMIVGGWVHNILLPTWPRIYEFFLIRRLFWYVPIWHNLELSQSMTDLCQTLSRSADAGMPLPDMLTQSLNLELNPVLYRRVVIWQHDVQSGADFVRSAQRAGMPPLFCGILATAGNNGKLPESLHFLAQAYQASYSRTLLFLQGIFQPLFVLCMALAVGIFALAFFLPLVKLINHVAGFPESF